MEETSDILSLVPQNEKRHKESFRIPSNIDHIKQSTKTLLTYINSLNLRYTLKRNVNVDYKVHDKWGQLIYSGVFKNKHREFLRRRSITETRTPVEPPVPRRNLLDV